MGGPGSGRKKILLPGGGVTYRSKATNHDGLVYEKFAAAAARARSQKWPNKKYDGRPWDFVVEVLHEHPLPHQIDIMKAALATNKVAVRSGQKTGKTKLAVWMALWVYCTFEGAEVLVTATTKPQVKGVLWKQLNDTIRHARKFGFEIENPAENPETGLRSSDGRIIRGVTTREVEALSGISGPHMWFIIDEASSLEQRKFEGIEGNTIGGGHIFMISNPTRTEGPFFDAFHHPTIKKFWSLFHLDSEEIAKWCYLNGVVIPGVATLKVIEQWKEAYTVDAAFFIMRVKGDFVMNEQGKIISLDLLEKSKLSWVGHGSEGTLQIGIDPAGPGLNGDKWGFAVRRGMEIRRLYTRIGLSKEAGLEEVRGLLKEYRRGDEIPRLVIDSEGPIGSEFFGKMKAIGDILAATKPHEAWETFGLKASSPAKRKPNLYQRVRDEAWANLSEWMRNGGAIPPDDAELETELHAPNWEGSPNDKLNRLKVTDKEDLRELLDRSPDKADAVICAVWNPRPWEDAEEPAAPPPRENTLPPSRTGVFELGKGALNVVDPYALINSIMRRG